MSSSSRASLAVAFAASLLLLSASPDSLGQAASADGWRFSLAPYLWLPNIDGTLKFSAPPGADGRPDVTLGPNDYLQNLDAALMLAGEARKGDWAIVSDLIYLSFSSENASVKTVTGPGGAVQVPVNTNTSGGLKGTVWTIAASRTLVRSPAATFEVLGGLRYLGVEASVNWQFAGGVGLLPQAGSHSQKEELWDAIIGIRGRAALGGGKWFVPYYLDLGGGSSALTWQGMTGIGYAWPWGEAILAYRHLYYEQNDAKLIQDIRFSGPALGVNFRF